MKFYICTDVTHTQTDRQTQTHTDTQRHTHTQNGEIFMEHIGTFDHYTKSEQTA